MAFIENVKSNRFEGKSALKTYLYHVYSNKYVDFIRKTKTNKMSVHETQPIQDWVLSMPDGTKNALQKLISEHEVNVLKDKVKLLGEKWQQMLRAWGEGFADSKIAEDLGYQTANAVKVSRLRCIDKLKGLYKI